MTLLNNVKITELATYVKCKQGALYHMKKTNPKKFELLCIGYIVKFKKEMEQ